MQDKVLTGTLCEPIGTVTSDGQVTDTVSYMIIMTAIMRQ
jgi:hypothetical protein